MTFNLAEITRNKPLMYAGGAAAALGLIAWWRNRNASAATTTSTGGTQPQAGQAVFDSTGTDLRSAIGDLGAGLQQQLATYFAGQTNGPAAIQTSTNGSSGATTPSLGSIAAQPLTAGDTAANWGWFRAKKAETAAQLAAEAKISVSDLQILNPGMFSSPSSKVAPGTWVRNRLHAKPLRT